MSQKWKAVIKTLKKHINFKSSDGDIWLFPQEIKVKTPVGYKLHIPFNENDDTTSFVNLVLEVNKLKVPYKLVSDSDILMGIQMGKHFIIYPSDLVFLSELSFKSKSFLFTESAICIEGEHKIDRTRIYTSFCDYYDREFFSFDENAMVVGESNVGLPSFAWLPPTMDFFDGYAVFNEGKILSDKLVKLRERVLDAKKNGSLETIKKLKSLCEEEFSPLWDMVMVDKSVSFAFVDYYVFSWFALALKKHIKLV